MDDIFAQRQTYCTSRLEELATLADHPDFAELTNLCAYATGSYGRGEASASSDLDIFFLHNGYESHNRISIIDNSLMNAALIKRARDMELPAFSDGGRYLEIHYLRDVLDHMGSPNDDYRNYFTARMLLLLESVPIVHRDVYEDAILSVIESYYRDYHDHEKEFLPVFLVNDILRFWRTLCLNYEHRRNRKSGMETTEKIKAHLRNLKLKYSRLWTCYSMVIAILAEEDCNPDNVARLVNMTPYQRLRHVGERREDLQGTVLGVISQYKWFLERMGRPTNEQVKWMSDKNKRDEAFGKARVFGESVWDLTVRAPRQYRLTRFLIV